MKNFDEIDEYLLFEGYKAFDLFSHLNSKDHASNVSDSASYLNKPSSYENYSSSIVKDDSFLMNDASSLMNYEWNTCENGTQRFENELNADNKETNAGECDEIDAFILGELFDAEVR